MVITFEEASLPTEYRKALPEMHSINEKCTRYHFPVAIQFIKL